MTCFAVAAGLAAECAEAATVPEALQLKAILATAVFSLMDRDGLTAREAKRMTGVDAADFSRIRNADFRRLSIERRMTINARPGSRIEVDVRVKPRPSRMNDDASSIAL